LEKKPIKRDVPTKIVTRKRPQADANRQAQERAKAEAREAAAARNRFAREVGRLASDLGSNLSKSTEIELKGPGGGGIPYANFLQAVKSVYARAWVVPDGVTDEEATATVSVTIVKDGTVLTSRITRTSGNDLVDRSVQATLDRVKYAAPLPEDSSDTQRTVTIHFNVKAKRASA
jgi:colicin import membrane protein